MLIALFLNTSVIFEAQTTMMNKKILPYVIVGVPLIIGALFLIKAIKNKKRGSEETPTTDPVTPTPSPNTGGGGYTPSEKLPFKKGMQSDYIKKIQEKLGGLTVDGKFGNNTYNKVVAFQKSKLLTADGIVGAITWRTMFGADFPLTYDPQYGGAKPLVELPTKPTDPFFPRTF